MALSSVSILAPLLLIAPALAQPGNDSRFRIGGHPVELRLGFVGQGIARFQFLPILDSGSVSKSTDAPHLLQQSWKGEWLRLRALPAQRVSVTNGRTHLSLEPGSMTIRLGIIGAGPSLSIQGAREIARPVDLQTLPLYVRAGAILPHGPKELDTAEKPNNPLAVHVYPGADGRFTMIEDDGITFSSVPMRLAFQWDDTRKSLRVALEDGSRMRPPSPRLIQLQLIGTTATRDIAFQGSPVEARF